MNMISKLRSRIKDDFATTITFEEFDQLQREWITRTGSEDMVIAEREACAVFAENFSTSDGYEIAHSIRARSNVQGEALPISKGQTKL